VGVLGGVEAELRVAAQCMGMRVCEGWTQALGPNALCQSGPGVRSALRKKAARAARQRRSAT
jgi:hypothetical protein